MCTSAWFMDGHKAENGNPAYNRQPPISAPTIKTREIVPPEKYRLFAMAVRVWLHEGDKMAWDYYNCRKSYI